MCDITAYFSRDGSEQVILENVDQVQRTGDEVRLVNIFGEEKILAGRMIYYSNTDKKMVFEAA